MGFSGGRIGRVAARSADLESYIRASKEWSARSDDIIKATQDLIDDVNLSREIHQLKVEMEYSKMLIRDAERVLRGLPIAGKQ
jgi:hypothetical protein